MTVARKAATAFPVYLTFIGPCIANIFALYNQQDATFLKFINFSQTLYMFQTVFRPIISSSKLHIQRQVFVRPLLLPAAGLARLAAGGSNGLTLCVRFGAADGGTEKPSETCRASDRN
jgi:hypothetical protein